MIKMFKSVINFVSEKWNQFKQFVVSVIKGKPAKAKEEPKKEETKITAEELKPMTYANKEEEAIQEVASDSVEEVKEVVEPTEEEIEQACAELTDSSMTEETKAETIEQAVNEVVEELTESNVQEIAEKCKEHTPEEIDSDIKLLLNDEVESAKLAGMFASKNKSRNFANNIANATKKMNGKVLSKSERNQIAVAVREGKYFTNEEYRMQFATLMSKGLISL